MTTSSAIILRHFPALTAQQKAHFERLGTLYPEWNERVNLISRKDIEHLYERHILHSLGIAKVYRFAPGMRIIDVGTGGGFPLVPLAILFQECSFHGIDGIGKKIRAVQGVIEGLGLTNCTAEQVRSEDHKRKYDFIVSRAVTALPDFIRATRHLVPKDPRPKEPLSDDWNTGMLYLKGGQLADEIMPVTQPVRVIDLNEFFPGEFFATKKVVAVSL
ncbi:MAG TPA: 16S rRNA (guanine(527)-N(7))-methyltransferase RsmG [Flavobacteriales bacterium]